MDQTVCTITTHVSGEHGGVWHNVLDVATMPTLTSTPTPSLHGWCDQVAVRRGASYHVNRLTICLKQLS